MRWLKYPALHMVALGALLFGFVELKSGALGRPKPRIEIPAHRFEQMLQEFAADTGRRPSPEEWRQMVDMQVDDELLFQYALSLGMQENSAAQARLAQIAEFVEANPHESTDNSTQTENAKVAMQLGLHEGDLVVRRILVDSARRLIRGVVLLQQPTEEALEKYYAATSAYHASPPRVRLVQVAINGFLWPDTEKRAFELLGRIREQNLSRDAALALADTSLVSAELPLETQKQLETQMGSQFAAAVMQLPTGSWSEPIPSIHGHHLVLVEEREESKVPPLAEVRERVEQQMLEKLADEWLKLRLKELRLEFDIVLPGSKT